MKCNRRLPNNVRTEDTIDWAPDEGDPDADTGALNTLFPHGAFAHALGVAGFSEVSVRSSFVNKPVNFRMRLGRNPPYASVRDVRVAVQRVVRSIGFTVRRDGYLLRLHTGRVTAKFRVAKRRVG